MWGLKSEMKPGKQKMDQVMAARAAADVLLGTAVG